jgi:hypothetical protein
VHGFADRYWSSAFSSAYGQFTAMVGGLIQMFKTRQESLFFVSHARFRLQGRGNGPNEIGKESGNTKTKIGLEIRKPAIGRLNLLKLEGLFSNFRKPVDLLWEVGSVGQTIRGRRRQKGSVRQRVRHPKPP